MADLTREPRVRRFMPLLVIGLLALGSSGVVSEDLPGAARLIPISGAAWAGSSVNVVANIRQSVFTHGRTQFAAFYDADRFMVLARRSLDAGQWETRRTAYQGNVADAHNSISLVVDGAGVLHVAWDHHASQLNYARGVAPGSIELGPRQAMTGQLREPRHLPAVLPPAWRRSAVPLSGWRVGPRVARAQPLRGGEGRMGHGPDEPHRWRRRKKSVLGHDDRPPGDAAPGLGLARVPRCRHQSRHLLRAIVGRRPYVVGQRRISRRDSDHGAHGRVRRADPAEQQPDELAGDHR